ncbi:MAG: flagellar hook protein FlgE, partial [Betaproteobacteria bacterium HGW-Betaproteobacteria-21]
GVVFADTFAAAMTGGAAGLQIGAGSNTQAVRQSFSQGGLTATNNPLDMSINGNGFFVIERNNGTTAYSRNGQFDLDKDGYIVTPLGEKLMGYQTVGADGSVSLTGTGTPRPLYIPPVGLGAKATDQVSIRANLDSSSAVPGVAPIDRDDPDTYNYTTSIRVFDSLGNEHTLGLYFVKQAVDATATPPVPPNMWNVYESFDNAAFSTPPTPSATLEFKPDGTIKTITPLPVVVPAVPYTFSATLVDADPLNFPVNLAAFTQRNSASTTYELRQNGYKPGEIAGVSVTSNGIVQGTYSNGETRALGQVVLASFRNPNGLISLGSNLWAATTDAGEVVQGVPGEGLNGTLSSGQIEESNVDLSQELVQMIIQQRNYQANAQSIRTQDQLLQTLINLR